MSQYLTRFSSGEFLPQLGKVNALVENGALLIEPKRFMKNLICVIDSQNKIFESALRVTEEDFHELKKDDGRLKTFLIYE